MITEEQIKSNKERYIDLVKGITRENFDHEGLLNYLENSDFFQAPASSKYHGAYPGGLCYHSLNVYDNLKLLVEGKGFSDKISEDTIRIISLFHDISKTNFYEVEIKNKKQYFPEGTKHDSGGNYEWIAVQGYKVRELPNRFLFGNHEETAEFITSQYVPLSIEESVSILHHMGGAGYDSSKDDITAIFNNYPLAALLHTADMVATFVDEVIL